MNPWKQDLLVELCQQGIMDEAQAAACRQQAEMPWFAALLSGMAAWLAALLLAGSVLLPFIDVGGVSMLIAALVLLGVAIGLLRQQRVFAGQLGLALSLAGQALLVYAVADWMEFDHYRSVAGMVVLVAAVMLRVPALFLHRLACVLLEMGAVMVLLGWHWLPLFCSVLAIMAVLLWLGRPRWATSRNAGLYRALASAATLVALAVPALDYFYVWGGIGKPLSVTAWQGWLPPLLVGALLLSTCIWLLRKSPVMHLLGGAAVALILSVLGHQTPGFLIAAALWLALFQAGERFWCILVGIGASLYLGQLYYGLHMTLLHKSILLMLCGVVLLGARYCLLKSWGDSA